jgi:hypothetical protein
MSHPALESAGAEIPSRRLHTDPLSGQSFPVSARAETDRSFITAIRADIGEAEAYKQALHRRGEIGLQRPLGVNVSGVDFITAARNPKGQMEIIVTDVKTRATPTSRFPSAKKAIPGTWSSEADQATSAARLRLNNPALEKEIRDAFLAGRIRLRQLNVDYTPAGQGAIIGW